MNKLKLTRIERKNKILDKYFINYFQKKEIMDDLFQESLKPEMTEGEYLVTKWRQICDGGSGKT